MSLLTTSRAFVRRELLFPQELLFSCLHTSSSCSSPSRGRGSSKASRISREPGPTTPSRTRLVKDLTPRATTGHGRARLEVAPPPIRDTAPHSSVGIRDRFKEREEQLCKARELKQKKDAWLDRRDARKANKEVKVSRSSTTGWEQSKGNLRMRRVIADDLPDFDQPWRTRKEDLQKTQKPGTFGMRQATEHEQVAEKPRKAQVQNPLSDELEFSARAEPINQLPTEFASPPLMEGLVTSVMDVLGPHTPPTPIQALSLKHFLKRRLSGVRNIGRDIEYHQCLLASETGSGKSIAYMLPMFQDLKLSELQPGHPEPLSKLMSPRALILAPTHELSRQLSGFAKALLHEIKLRVLCISRANLPSSVSRNMTGSKLANSLDIDDLIQQEEVGQAKSARPVDVMVGTPSKILELVKGRGWDREQPTAEDAWVKDEPKPRRFTVGKSEMSLERVEWVVIDEADVLFDPDFQEHTTMVLSAIAEARGQPPEHLDVATLSKFGPENPAPVNYPFNLLLSTATIPSALAWYLDTHHPALLRLASPNLHHLPKTLKTQHVPWTGGNRSADVEHQLRYIWHRDSLGESRKKSKVLIFCNKSTKVEELGRYLKEKGITNVALTSTSEARKRGNNHHLDGFLKTQDRASATTDGSATSDTEPSAADASQTPHVMITTSLLSRGLDFSRDLKHIFIVDEPRNMVDFLHRAGRSGRAGEEGQVVVFGKTKGRGSAKAKDMRKKVGALVA